MQPLFTDWGERESREEAGNESDSVDGVMKKTKGEERRNAKYNENPAAGQRALRVSCRQTKGYSLARDGSQIVCAWQKQKRITISYRNQCLQK